MSHVYINEPIHFIYALLIFHRKHRTTSTFICASGELVQARKLTHSIFYGILILVETELITPKNKWSFKGIANRTVSIACGVDYINKKKTKK